MTDKKNDEVTKLKEAIGSLQGNFNLLLTSAISHMKSNNQSIEELALSCGKIGAKTWSEDVSLEDVAHQLASMMSLFGAKIESKDIKTNEGTFVVKDYPSNDLLNLAEITPEDFEKFYAIWKPIVEKQNMKYSFERDKDRVKISIKK